MCPSVRKPSGSQNAEDAHIDHILAEWTLNAVFGNPAIFTFRGTQNELQLSDPPPFTIDGGFVLYSSAGRDPRCRGGVRPLGPYTPLLEFLPYSPPLRSPRLFACPPLLSPRSNIAP